MRAQPHRGGRASARSSAAAAVADAPAGEVVFLGTPAEEGGGGKIKMIEAGVFEGIDAAMMFHPFDRDMLAHPALASVWLAMTFHGAPAHAAAAPHDGKSALTACMDTFRLDRRAARSLPRRRARPRLRHRTAARP